MVILTLLITNNLLTPVKISMLQIRRSACVGMRIPMIKAVGNYLQLIEVGGLLTRDSP